METPIEKECFVKVAKGDLEKLTTEVMQLREFLPRVVKDLLDLLRKEKENELIAHDQERLSKECLHLGSRLDWAETERQREREEKLALKEELWACRQQMQQQAQFCVDLGAASCTVLWSTSGREQAVGDMLAHGELQPFLDMAAQTLESFVRSHHSKAELQEQNSSEHQFVLALAGVITNIAAVSCGRDYLSNCGHALLDTLLQLLKLMETGTHPRLKVLMLKALYNVSISVRGLKYISQSPLLLPMICTLLEDGDADVCLHSLRVLQSLLLEEEAAVAMGAALMDSPCVEHVGRLTSSPQHALRRAARDTVDDLEALFRKFGKSVDQSGLVQ